MLQKLQGLKRFRLVSENHPFMCVNNGLEWTWKKNSGDLIEGTLSVFAWKGWGEKNKNPYQSKLSGTELTTSGMRSWSANNLAAMFGVHIIETKILSFYILTL